MTSENEIQTVLVTAASGNAGRASVEALLDKGFQVVAAARDPSRLSFSRAVEARIYNAGGQNDFDVLLDGIDDLVLITPPSDGNVHQKVSSLIAPANVGEFIAEALIQELTGEFIVTGPAALDHFEVAELLSRKKGQTITYIPISEQQLGETYASRGMPPESVDYGLTLYRAYRNQATAAITDGFRQATGRDPIDFATFLGLD